MQITGWPLDAIDAAPARTLDWFLLIARAESEVEAKQAQEAAERAARAASQRF